MRISESKSSIAQSEFIKPENAYLFGLTLFYIALAFNFNTIDLIEGGQFLRISIASFSSIGFVIAYFSCRPVAVDFNQFPYTNIMLKTWLFYAIYLFIITLIRSEDLINTIYYSSPWYLMVMSMILATRHIQAGYNPRPFWIIFITMGVLSTIITAYFARFTSQVYEESTLAFVEDVRYKVISATTMILISVGMVNLAKSKQIVFSSLIVFLVIFIYVISKTRNIIIGALAVTIYAIAIHDRRTTAALRIGFLLLGAVTLIYLFVLNVQNFDLYDAWIGRVFDVDNTIDDTTYITRLAEYSGQITKLLSSPMNAIFGFGVTERMYWDPALWDILNPGNDPTYFYDTYTNGLHSTWINSLFHGGFIIGTIPFITITFVVMIAVKLTLAPSQMRRSLDIYTIYSLAMVFMMYGPGFFGSAFGERLGPVSLGVALIYAVYGWEVFRKARSEATPNSETSEPQSLILSRPHIS